MSTASSRFGRLWQIILWLLSVFDKAKSVRASRREIEEFSLGDGTVPVLLPLEPPFTKNLQGRTPSNESNNNYIASTHYYPKFGAAIVRSDHDYSVGSITVVKEYQIHSISHTFRRNYRSMGWAGAVIIRPQFVDDLIPDLGVLYTNVLVKPVEYAHLPGKFTESFQLERIHSVPYTQPIFSPKQSSLFSSTKRRQI